MMKKLISALAAGLLLVGLTGIVRAQDNGIRDSLYITCPDSLSTTIPLGTCGSRFLSPTTSQTLSLIPSQA